MDVLEAGGRKVESPRDEVREHAAAGNPAAREIEWVTVHEERLVRSANSVHVHVQPGVEHGDLDALSGQRQTTDGERVGADGVVVVGIHGGSDLGQLPADRLDVENIAAVE